MADMPNVNQTDATEEDGYLSEGPVPMHTAELYPRSGSVHSVPQLRDVDDRAIQTFLDQGYLVVDQGLDAGEVEAAGSGLYDLIDGKYPDFRSITVESEAKAAFKTMAVRERREVVRKVFNFIDVEPNLTALSKHKAILGVVGRMMDDEPAMLQDMAMLKPARIGREKPWHQDCAYFNVPTGSVVVGVWVALDQATIENGCLSVIPESHKQGPHPHFKMRDWQICDTEVQVERGVPVPLEPGGLLFWHGLTHHGSPANTSDEGRRGIQLHYHPAGMGEMTTEERMGLFGGEGLGMTC